MTNWVSNPLPVCCFEVCLLILTSVLTKALRKLPTICCTKYFDISKYQYDFLKEYKDVWSEQRLLTKRICLGRYHLATVNPLHKAQGFHFLNSCTFILHIQKKIKCYHLNTSLHLNLFILILTTSNTCSTSIP